MDQFNADVQQLGLGRQRLFTMQYYFTAAKNLPRTLVTANTPLMQRAYISVPAEIWWERVHDLQTALHLYRTEDGLRMAIANGRLTGMSAEVDTLVDAAFAEKYDQLLSRVKHDFSNYFPYEIKRTNQKLMVFERLNDMQLIEHVLKQL